MEFRVPLKRIVNITLEIFTSGSVGYLLNGLAFCVKKRKLSFVEVLNNIRVYSILTVGFHTYVNLIIRFKTY